MKKYLYALIVFCSINTATAQMNEMIGVMGVSGVLNSNAYNNVGQMQSAMSRMQLQQDVTLLVNQIQSVFMQNYLDIDVSLLDFNGLRGVKWDVVPVSSAEFYISLQDIDGASCFIVKNNPWGANRVEVNGGKDCQQSDNVVKLYF